MQMEWYVNKASQLSESIEELAKKYWLIKQYEEFYFRPLVPFYQLKSEPEPNIDKEDSVLFKLLNEFDFRRKGIIVLPEFYNLRRQVLDAVDTDCLIFTDRSGYFSDSEFKSVIQNFNNLEDKISQNFDFYIYDFTKEIDYSLLELPFKLIIQGKITILPHIIVFTNLLSPRDSKQLTRMFGKIKRPKYKLDRLFLYDYRDTVRNRGYFDMNYIPLSEDEVIDFYIKLFETNALHTTFRKTLAELYPKVTKVNKLLVCCTNVDYAAIELTKLFKCKTLVINDVSSKQRLETYIFEEHQIPDYYYEMEELDPEDRGEHILSDFLNPSWTNVNDINFDEFSIIVLYKDCYDNLPLLNFNCHYAINTNFEWNLQNRIELAQFVRNFGARYLLTYSDAIPSTLQRKIKINEIKYTYDLNYQNVVFKSYNII